MTAGGSLDPRVLEGLARRQSLTIGGGGYTRTLPFSSHSHIKGVTVGGSTHKRKIAPSDRFHTFD